MNNVLKKATYKKSYVLFSLIVSISCVLGGFLAFFKAVTTENYFGRNDDVISLMYVCAIVMFACAAISTISGAAGRKMFICVCDNMVYGMASTSNFFLKAESFEINLSDITSISCSPNLEIGSRSKKYILRVEDAKEVYEFIQKQMGISKN